jgi:hypothetical protein
MIQSTTLTQTAPATAPSINKEARLKYGVRKAALVVSPDAKAFRKDMEFDHAETKAESWVVIDPNLKLPHPEGTLVRANTYNQNIGKRADYLNPSNCRVAPTDEKDIKKVTKGYTEVPLLEVPFIVIGDPALPADEIA